MDLSLGTGERQNYPDNLDNVAPLIRMAFQTTPGIGGSNGLVLGFFRIQAKYSVRGRRSEALPVSTRLQMMSFEERAEAIRYLEAERLKSLAQFAPQR